MSFVGKTLQANGLNFDDSEKIWTPGVCLPPPRGNIHVYYSDIQRSSSLKLLGQSKPNFMRSIVRKWRNESIYKWSRSHDQDGCHGYKYQKPLKIFFSRTRRPMILKLGMKHQAMELYKVYINRDPWVTLTYFTARST